MPIQRRTAIYVLATIAIATAAALIHLISTSKNIGDGTLENNGAWYPRYVGKTKTFPIPLDHPLVLKNIPSFSATFAIVFSDSTNRNISFDNKQISFIVYDKTNKQIASVSAYTSGQNKNITMWRKITTFEGDIGYTHTMLYDILLHRSNVYKITITISGANDNDDLDITGRVVFWGGGWELP
jgi:hypothetical protein